MEVQAGATEIIRRLKHAGYIAYFAGGWVRDHLLNHQSSDIDIATNAPPPAILDLFPHTILVGLSFGVVIVVIEGVQFEVATFRKDLNYSNGRKPEQIELSTPIEDAKRRDFTINGMFYDPLDGAIYDYVGGVEDLKKGVIRTIGDPNERFIEDRLRMVRAIRFSCRFGFAIDIGTQNAIVDNAKTLFPAVAMERIWQELNKMNQTRHFDQAIIEMHRLKLLQEIFPSLEKSHLHDIKKQVASFKSFPKGCPTILYLLALFPNCSKDEAIALCQMLRTSNHDIALATLMLECRSLVARHLPANHVEWVHFYAQESSEVVLQADAATREEMLLPILENHKLRRESLHAHIERVIKKSPLVTAATLLERGHKPGKELGALLKEAERLAIYHDLHTTEAVLKQLL